MGDFFLSDSKIQKLILPATLTQIGASFLRQSSATRLELEAALPQNPSLQLDPSGIPPIVIGSSFLSNSNVESLILPKALQSLTNFFLSGNRAKRVDLSGTFLDQVGEGFLSFSAVEYLSLPATLKSVGNGFLDTSHASQIDLSCSSLESVGDRFLASSGVAKVLLPRTLKVVGKDFLSGSLAKRVDLTQTFLHRAGLGSFTDSEGQTLKVALPKTFIGAGET